MSEIAYPSPAASRPHPCLRGPAAPPPAAAPWRAWRRRLLLGLAAALPALAFAERPTLDVPYVPTPQPVVDRMLEMADVKSADFVMDVGCGDGRMIVSAARTYGARSLGIDIDPQRIAEAKANARRAGVTDKVEFRVGNLFEADLSRADVLAMYLLESVNRDLRPKILATMKPGARVVSHAFGMGEWQPDAQDTVDGAQVYLWVVPARVEGHWRVRPGPGEAGFEMRIAQNFQHFTGEAAIGGRTVPVLDGRLRGAEISFAIETEPGRMQIFIGRVEGDSIQASAGPGLAWLARRQP